MIQPELFNDASFWILISFLIFLGAVFRTGVKSFLAFLREKKETVTKQISEIDCLYEEAFQMVRTEEKKITDCLAALKKEEAATTQLIDQEKEELKRHITHLKKEHKKIQKLKQKELEEQAIKTIEHTLLEDVAQAVQASFQSKSHAKDRAEFVKKEVEALLN